MEKCLNCDEELVRNYEGSWWCWNPHCAHCHLIVINANED